MADEAQAPSQGIEPPTEAPQAPQAPETPQAQSAPETPPEAPTPTQEATPPQDEAPPQGAEGEQPQAVERIVPKADGYTLEEGMDPRYGEFFAKNDMTQEQADNVMKLDHARTEAEATALRAAGEAHVKGWGDSAETNMNLAKRGMNHLDPTGGLKKILNDSGQGNNPALLEMFYQFGQRMEEGGFLQNEVKTPTQPRSAAQTLYGNQGKN